MSDTVKPSPENSPERISYIAELQAFVRLVLHRFAKDQCMRIAAALSYTSLLALVPLGAIAFAILRAFPVFDDIQGQIKSLLFENFMPESVDGAQAYFDQFIGQTQGLTSVGIVALAVTAIMLLSTIEASFNSIFHVKAKRPFVPRLMMFWAVITLGPLLLGGSLSLGGYMYALAEWSGAGKIPGLGGVATRALPTILAIFAFAVFYAIVPYRPVRIRHAMFGGMAAGFLFTLVRKLFALYISTFPAYQTIYGAVSSIPIFLIWMYLSWAIVLIGAQVTASMPDWGRARAAESYGELSPARQLEAALAAIENLWRQARGETDLNPGRTKARADELAEALEVLRQKGFTGMDDRGEWLLARDPETLTVSDLAHGLELAPDPHELPIGGRAWRADLRHILEGADGTGMGQTLRQLFEGEGKA
ncbi:YihY family inner membrane protein [Pseudomonadota bacterium]